jgi:hypothetical protein
MFVQPAGAAATATVVQLGDPAIDVIPAAHGRHELDCGAPENVPAAQIEGTGAPWADTK